MSNNATIIELNNTYLRNKALAALSDAKEVERKQKGLQRVKVINGFVLTNRSERWNGYEPFRIND